MENPYSDTSRGIRIGEYHGYGLKNINRIVQENHGDFYTKKKDGVFTVQVRLNCEN
ncbi:GHKL domain-containing protein [Phascolarctobacterium succinatutens]|uniref:GHKL domain-containing protein n=1 Tax=Phascolarctobacterium succinatutens TaxID=626940 RepID=UPI0040280A79